MKRTLTLLAVLAAFGGAIAQERDIIMPEVLAKTPNIAEEGGSHFWCAIEAGGGSTVMVNRNNVAMVGASFAGGYRFSQYLKAGVGLGILYYPNNNNVRDRKSHLAMPLFINARGNILSDNMRHTVPYWSVSIGTTIPDGFFISPSVGLRIGEKRNAFLINIGYTLRHLKSHPGNITNYSGVLLRLGYEF